MFVWYKGPGQRSKTRFFWWPLVLSLVASIVLTILVNKVL